MVCHPHLLPQSSTSSSSIDPINLQPTANQASHRIYRPTIPINRSLDLLPQTINLPQTTHIQPLQPRNGPPFVVGLIKPMATDNPPYPQTHKHRIEVELLPQTTHLLPQNRDRAPSSDHPHATSATKKRRPIWIGLSSSPWPINYVGWKYTQPSPLKLAQRYLIKKFN